MEDITGKEIVLPTDEETFREDYPSYPVPEEKQNIFTYFKKVIDVPMNIKTANISKDEIGMVKLPVRSLLGISQYCGAMGMLGFQNYFKQEAQITLGTSLSFEGFLNKLAVTQKRESEIKTRGMPSKRRGFFGKKKEIQPYSEEEMSFY